MACRRSRPRRDSHDEQRRDHREIADAVDEEAPALADRGDHQTGDRRTDQARAVVHRRVDRDGVAEIIAIVHHLHEKRLPAGHVERVDQPLQRAERDDFPERDQMREGQRRERERLDRASRLRPHQQLPAIEALDPDARDRPERERDNLRRKLTTPRRSAEPVSR